MRAPSFAVRATRAVVVRLARLALCALFALLALAVTLLRPEVAFAQTPPDAEGTRARAEAILHLAEQEDTALAFAPALAHYEEARALDPSSPHAPRAEARAAILRARSEGGFGPFTSLERVRRDPVLGSSGRAVDELVREAESFPVGLVRVEAWVLAAEAYTHRLGRSAEADALLKRVVVDPAADSVLVQKAARDLVGLRVAGSDLRGAEEAVRLAGDRGGPTLGRDVRRLVRRRFMHHASLALLVAIVVLAARASVTAARRGRGPEIRAAVRRAWKLALAYAAYVAIGGALLAFGYEQGTSAPFLWFGAVLVPLVLVARAWSAAGNASWAARLGRASACAAGAAAAGFLVLEGVDVAFLEGMGL